jgi:spermidine synthase
LAESSASLARARVQTRTIAIDWVTPALVGVFILSGASGLIYQIAWVRLLALTFGITIYAVSTVVAAFMGGLALGSFLGGRLADRVQRPILLYAAAEAIVAIMGLLSPRALEWVQATYVALYPRDASEAVLSIVALRFALAALVLLIPTTMMGATLPLMVKGSLAMSRSIGPRISWLYASNTAGAILGTVAAGFIMIGTIGITRTITTAAILNLAAAAFALLLGAAIRPRSERAELAHARAVGAAAADEPIASPTVRTMVIATFALQGLASLAYEVIWTRVLAVILDGTTYAFSIVLATVLLGIALGAALVSPLMSRPLPWVKIYAVLQALVAAFAFLSVVVFAHIYGIMGHLNDLTVLRQVLASNFAWMAITAMVAILPPMILLGASFPIAARIAVSGPAKAGRDLGVLYAGNTAGAILGAWSAGFFLIPALGTQHAIELLATVNALLAIGLALASGPGRAAVTSAAVGLTAVAAALAVALAAVMYTRVVAGLFAGRDVVWVGEGMETSVAVVRNRQTGFLEMYNNGAAQASEDPGTVSFHRLVGHIPMTIHPDPQEILIVGIGGGSTAGAFARHDPARIDVAELSDTVLTGTHFFDPENGNILSWPGLNLQLEDGRNHLLLKDKKYDVVTADAVHPRNAGSTVLYSYDYYKLVSQSLKPGGMMSQWLEDRPDNPDNDAQRKLMARTFLRAFPHVTMWVWGALLIGSNDPIDIDFDKITAEWDQRNLGRILAGSGFDTPEEFRSLFAMKDEEVRAWAGDGPIMTDDQPFVEYYLSLPGREFVPRFLRRD